MSEKEIQQGENNSTENIGEGDKQTGISIIERAHIENERLEKNIAELREENNRKEDLSALNMLSGKAEAGQVTQRLTEDEKWAMEAKQRYADTGLDPTDDNTPTTYS